MDEQLEMEEADKGRRDLLIFWLRMFGYIAAGVGAPIATFAIKFGLFNTYGYETVTDELGNVVGARVALNGWGIVSVFIASLFAINLMKEVIDSYKGYSFAKQCLVGIYKKIIPLAIAIGAFYFLKGVIDQIIFCLTTLGICQIVAIPMDPLPKWSADHGKESYEDLISRGIALFKRRKGDR